MKSIKNNKSNIKKSPVAKNTTTKSESFPINADGLMLYLYNAGDKAGRYIRMDFKDYANCDDFLMVLDRPTLKGMADFILKYLENK